MDNLEIKSIEALYAESKQPVVVIDDGDNVVWKNVAADALNPGLRGAFRKTLELFGFERSGESHFIPLAGDMGCASGVFATPLKDGKTLLVFSTLDSGRLPPSDRRGNFFRNTMQDILFYVGGLSERCTSVRDEQELGRVRRRCYELLRSNINFTHLRRYYSGQLIADYRGCNLSNLLSTICDAARLVCPGGAGIRFEGEKNIVAAVDIKMVQNAVLNLIANSMIYTRDGNEIVVGLFEASSEVVITVSDKGAGIKSSLIDEVIKPFFSSDPYNDCEPNERLGLGLAVVETTALLHGGRLLVSSEFGRGTDIIMTLARREFNGDTVENEFCYGYVTDALSAVYCGLCDVCDLK